MTKYSKITIWVVIFCICISLCCDTYAYSGIRLLSLSLTVLNNDPEKIQNSFPDHVREKTDSAGLHCKAGNYDMARILLAESIQLSKQAEDWDTTVSLYEMLISVDSLSNNFKLAFKHQKEKEEIAQYLYLSRREQINQDLRDFYKTDSLQQQIKETEHKAALLNNKIKTYRYAAIILFVINCLFLISGIILIGIYHRKKKFNASLKAENEKNQSLLDSLTGQVKTSDEEINALVQKNISLEKSNAVKDKLLSVISHDLRSPMSSLQALLSLFNANNIARQDLVDFFAKLLSRVENTSTMLENLLHWSQYQLNGIEPIFEKADIQEIIDDSINFYRMQADQKHIVIDNSLKTSVHVYADVEMLKIILRNLISNALKFTYPGGIITIKAFNKDGYVVVSVKDTGTGISPENQMKMFATANFTTPGTEKEKGTGLGLTLCKDFVEHNHGKIWLDSKVGVGTTFYFSIPLAE